MNQERQEAIHYIQTGEPKSYKIDFTKSLLMIDIISDPDFLENHRMSIHNLMLKHPIIGESFLRVTIWQTQKKPQNFLLLDMMLTQQSPVLQDFYMWVELLESLETLDEEHKSKLEGLLWNHRYTMHHMILQSSEKDLISLIPKLNTIFSGQESLLHTLLCLHPAMMHLYQSSRDKKMMIDLLHRYPQCHKILYILEVKTPETEAEEKWLLSYIMLGYDFLLSNNQHEESNHETILHI